MVMTPEQLKAMVFPGESGGDYNALFGYANRPGGQFAGVNLTDMTVGQALEFANPRGPYAQSVKGQIGRVATPMGAYQVVGSTLREAVKGLGLTGNERMTPELQDQIGMWIYQNQGPGAWEAWGKGGGKTSSAAPAQSNGGGAMPMGLLSMDEEPQTFGQRFKADLKSGDFMDRLALAANSLRMNPDPNIAAMVEGRQERRETERQQNKTLEWLANLGTLQAQRALQYAEATGDIIGATKMALEQPDELRGLQIETARVNLERLKSGADADPNVQSSAPLPDQSGVVLTMRDGTVQVRTVGGEVLSGQAALDFVRSAQENAAEYQRSIYGAREAGKLETQAELGGAAAQATSEGGMRPQIAKEFMDKAATVQSSVTNMDSAIQAIDEGAQSGIVYDMLPNVTVASAELQNARQRLGLDVIGSVTFGALSEGEMTLAMDTAVPRGLGPQELREWLVRKRKAQAKAYTALQEAAMHFASGGTQADYLRKIGVSQGGAQAPTQGGPSDEELLRMYGGE
jgi:hypothetical protein